jgi:hypothetical protein
MTCPIDSQSKSSVTEIESERPKMLLDSESQAEFELRRKRFQEDHADRFALQNKIVEDHGLWCEGLVPCMSRSVGGLAAD